MTRSTCLALAAALVVLGGCKQRKYANDADTGAAAPATTLDRSNTTGDTTDLNRATGRPGVSGDSTAGRRDTTRPAGAEKRP